MPAIHELLDDPSTTAHPNLGIMAEAIDDLAEALVGILPDNWHDLEKGRAAVATLQRNLGPDHTSILLLAAGLPTEAPTSPCA
jgi:hypothetical protein